MPYAAGLLTIAVALLSPLDPIGDRYLLSAHMMQHVLLSDIAPALLILGLRAPILPLGLSREALLAVAPAGGKSGRVLARLTSPWLAVPLWALATWIWAIPSVFDYAAQHQLVHALEHATLFYTGLAMWWLIIDPLPRARLRPNGQRLALLGFTRLASACVCLPLTWLSTTEYPLYASAPRAYRPVGDQRPAPRRREHVLHRGARLRHRLRRRLHQHPRPRRLAHDARRIRRSRLARGPADLTPHFGARDASRNSRTRCARRPLRC